MKQSILLVVALLAPLFWSSHADAQDAPAKKMNVLLIAVDDLRPQLGCYGAAQMKTPNIDALAASGTLFNRAYCQQAVCSPSRISLLTGKRPDTTHIYDLSTHVRKKMPDVVTLPQYFKNNGYVSQGLGKIWHGGLDDAASWSVPHTPNRAPQYGSPEILAYVKSKGAEGWEQGGKNKGPAWESADVPDNALCDGWICDRAIEAIKGLKDKPFFLAVGFEKPHLPFVAPKKYFDLYPMETIKLPDNFEAPDRAPQIALTDWGELRAYQGVPKKGQFDEKAARELIRGYYAATSFADAQVGRLLSELKSLGLADNTIVILWGDHGYQLGEQGLWCKHTNFENSTRTVLIVSKPGDTAGRSNALVELVDVYPTICDLTGLPIPSDLEGTSLVPLLKDASADWDHLAFSQYPRQGDKVMGYSIRTDRYRYNEWQENWKTPEQIRVVAAELYDHRTDPEETVNLANDPKHANDRKQLSLLLKQGWKAAKPPRP